MSIKNLIAMSVRQPNLGNIQIIDWAVQRIADLEQENEELKTIRDMLIQKEQGAPDADVIELFIEGVNDKYGYHTGVNTNWVVNVEDMKECIKQLHQKAQVTK